MMRFVPPGRPGHITLADQMPTDPTAAQLLTNLTLGTARRPLDPAVRTWLEERDAVDPVADDGEQLLAAYALTERLARLQAGPMMDGQLATAPAETRQLPGPRVVRALELILGDTYPALLNEAVTVLNGRNELIPPHLLPKLLERAMLALPTRPTHALRLRNAGGERAVWLADQNPEWAELSAAYDLADAWAKEATPGRRTALLRRWRMSDPVAAREAVAKIWRKESPKNQEVLLSAFIPKVYPEDQDWLREQLTPKRKGVRRMILRLLLLSGEEQAIADLQQLAISALDDDGKLLPILKPDPEARELLAEYGGLAKGESLAVFLLQQLPPNFLPDLTGREYAEFWVTLTKEQLAAAARAIIAFSDDAAKRAFVEFGLVSNPAQLPAKELAELTTTLPQSIFLDLFHDLLTNEKNVLHYGGLPRLLALSREEPWSPRISKAFVLQLVSTIRDIHQLPFKLQRDLQEHWRVSLPLLDPTIFGWARTHLHSMTERTDAFGKLATETLQQLAFRQVLHGRAL